MVSVDDCVSLAPDQAMCVQGGSFQADGESLVADGLVVHCLCDCGDVVWQGGMRHGDGDAEHEIGRWMLVRPWLPTDGEAEHEICVVVQMWRPC